MEEQEKKLSKYSSGINIIIRLDGLWRDANSHSRNGLFQKWNADLDRIWCELARDLSDDEYKKYKEGEKEGEKVKQIGFDSFDKQLSAIGNFEDSATGTFEDLTQEQIDNRGNQYKILFEKDLFLRRLENHLGKGTTWDEGDEDDFE